MGRILDDAEAVALRERADAGHVAGLTAEMHGHHDLRQPPVCFCGFELSASASTFML
jgi:hypothetical protein